VEIETAPKEIFNSSAAKKLTDVHKQRSRELRERSGTAESSINNVDGMEKTTISSANPTLTAQPTIRVFQNRRDFHKNLDIPTFIRKKLSPPVTEYTEIDDQRNLLQFSLNKVMLLSSVHP
jgi:hypothetical protein